MTDGLLARAERSGTVPKFFHLLTNSEYFNRAGSLVHTDADRHEGRRPAADDAHLHHRVGAAHGPGAFPPARNHRRRTSSAARR